MVQSPVSKLLTEVEAAGFLRSNRSSLWRWRHARRDPLPCYKLGNGPKSKLLYDEGSLVAWLARRQIKPKVAPTPRLTRTRRPARHLTTGQAEGVCA